MITSPFRVTLGVSEWTTLTLVAAAPTSSVRDVLRARIVLAAAVGRSNAEMAAGCRSVSTPSACGGLGAAEIAWEAAARLLTEVAPAVSTVRRWLSRDAIKPWQHRSWILPSNSATTAPLNRSAGVAPAKISTCS